MFLLVTVIGMIITPILMLCNLIYPRIPTGRLTRLCIRIYGLVLIKVVPFMAPVELEDRSGGFDQPAIFIPNHNSSIDPYLFGILPCDSAFITSWPFSIPFYNFFMRLAEYINSTKGWEHVQARGLELFKSGCSLVIWPEGHRSRDGKLRRFKNGAFQLALASGRPIVPVCIIGSRKMLPPGSRFLTPARIKVILLPTIIPNGLADNPGDIKLLNNQTREAIAAELEIHQNTGSTFNYAAEISPESSLESRKSRLSF